MLSSMMKTASNKLRRDETGQAFILVLILLILGALIIAPLLGFMSTGLIAGQLNEERMAELYAADAGIEDAIWKLMNDQLPAEEDQPYYLTVNGKNVEVSMSGEADTEITLLINLEVLPDSPSSYNKAKPQAEWLVIYVPERSTPDTYDTYRITAFYSSTQKRDLLGAGFWIHQYRGDNVTAIEWDPIIDQFLPPMDLDGNGFIGDQIDINGTVIDENNIITRPLITGYENDDYPYPVRTAEFLAGVSRAFIWEWGTNQGPKFAEPSDPVFIRTQRFALDPPIILGENEKFPANVAWLDTKQESISISCTGEAVSISPIIAIATDPATGKSTTIISHVFTQSFPDGSVVTTILTWESDIQ